jgi:hypothetical protein
MLCTNLILMQLIDWSHSSTAFVRRLYVYNSPRCFKIRPKHARFSVSALYTDPLIVIVI